MGEGGGELRSEESSEAESVSIVASLVFAGADGGSMQSVEHLPVRVQ